MIGGLGNPIKAGGKTYPPLHPFTAFTASTNTLPTTYIGPLGTRVECTEDIMGVAAYPWVSGAWWQSLCDCDGFCR